MEFESIYANYSVDELQEKSELAIQKGRRRWKIFFLVCKKAGKFSSFSNEFLFMPSRRKYSREKDGFFFRVTKYYWTSLNLRNIKGISWKEQNLTIGWWTQQTHTHGPRFWLNLVGRTLDCCNPDFGGSFCFRPRRNLNVKREPADSPLRY